MEQESKSPKPKVKITVQIWGALAKSINREFKALHIRRDMYLNDLLKREIEELDREVDFRNSDEIRYRLQGNKLPNRIKVTLELDEELVERMSAVLKAKNIPRDAFINRVLFFLAAKREHLDALGINHGHNEVSGKLSPISGAWASLYSPFMDIRKSNDGRFYTLPCFVDGPFGQNGPNLFAMNCAIDESHWQQIKSMNEESRKN